MGFRNRLIVYKKGGEGRKGRGFSREELKKAGIGTKQALSIGLPVDVRRRTAHARNVKLIKQQLKKSISKTGKKAS